MDKTIDLPRIVDRHERQVSGKKILFVPLNPDVKSDRLLIVMSAHNQGGKYMALRSFLESQVCDLLFVSDPKNSWYLDEDEGETFSRIFRMFSSDYRPESIFFFGSSMSGYGAIFHAFKLNANAIASNPQINLDITKDYAWPELIEHIEEIGGRHVNLDEIAQQAWGESAVYVIHGHDEIDTINVELLTRAAPPNKKLIVQTLDVDSHVMFFGKEVGYIYSVMNLLATFRSELNLQGILAQLVPEDKTNRRQLRAERKQSKVQDPYRSMDHSGQSVSWQNRYLHQQAGKELYFSNVGFYSEGSLSGATCFFDGQRWRLVSPTPSLNDNIMAVNTFKTPQSIAAVENNQFLNEYWWVRNDAASDLVVRGGYELVEIDLRSVNSKNIYLSTSIKMGVKAHQQILGKYLTLSADVFSSEGDVYLTLGGVGDSGYHHINSPKNQAGSWKRIHIAQQFLSINSAHRDAIFVRVNIAGDGKPKKVLLKNVSLQVGYFPMGFA